MGEKSRGRKIRGKSERGSGPGEAGARAADATLLYQWPVKLDQRIGCSRHVMEGKEQRKREHRERVEESVI